MKTFVFIIYNLIYLVGSAWFLLYANTYLNAKIIPDSFRWKDGHIRDDLTLFGISLLVILLIETGVLIFLNYKLNKWYTVNILNLENNLNATWWATGVIIGILIIFIVFLNAAAYR